MVAVWIFSGTTQSLSLLIPALGSLERTSKAQRDLFMVSDAIVEKENIHNSLTEEIFSSQLWKFQSSCILNTSEFFGLPELPTPGNSNPFCGESVAIFWHCTNFCWGDKHSKNCCKIYKMYWKRKHLMPNELRVIEVLSIL